MTGVIALAIEHIVKDFHCFNFTQADIIQTLLFVYVDYFKQKLWRHLTGKACVNVLCRCTQSALVNYMYE